MTGQEIAERTPQQELVAAIRAPQFKEQVKLALPSDVSPERFVRATITALMQNPDLAGADRESLLYAVIRSAQDGLLPDGREAALVMFGRKAAYLPMVSGYRKIAGEHDWTIRSAVVREKDEFDYELGLDAKLTHRPPRPGVDRGPLIGAYAVGVHRDGRREFEFMDAAEIEKVRQVSRTKDSGPWKDWPERMFEKTVARRLFKKLPLGDRERVARVLAADDPAGSADVLYGPGAGQVFKVSPAATRADGAPDVAAARGAAGAGDAEEHSPAVSPGPGFSDGEQDEPDTSVADSAGLFKVPAKAKPFGGMTIAEAHGQQDGPDFLRYALDPARAWAKPDHADHLFYEAVKAYAQVYAPDLLFESEAA